MHWSLNNNHYNLHNAKLNFSMLSILKQELAWPIYKWSYLKNIRCIYNNRVICNCGIEFLLHVTFKVHLAMSSTVNKDNNINFAVPDL